MLDDDHHWATYNDHQLDLGRAPRPLLREALRLIGPGEGRTALDLGCGAGLESLELARAGWQVLGLDVDETAPERFARYVDPDLAQNVQVRVVDLATAPVLPAADLVHASYSLPYVGASALPEVWARIEGAVAPGGWFVGQIFGDRDSFNDGTGAQAFLRRDQAEELLAGWELHHFVEEDQEGPSFSGPKHWHVFHVIARRRGLSEGRDGMAAMTNPLLAPSTLPFSLPDYANLTDAHVREAVEAGMTQHLTELEALAAETGPATVDNVLHAWERSGGTLDRTLSAFWVAKAADTNPERDAIMAEFSPRMAAHNDAIMLNRGLYDRLLALRARVEAGEVELDEQDAFNLDERIKGYERGGITLPEPQQARLRELNAELASLSNSFDTALVAGRNAAAVHVTDEAELAGLSEDDKAGLREAARARDLEGWLIEIVNTSGQPILDSLEHRPLRERVYRASVGRGLAGGEPEHDTRATLVKIARLRAERAELLGYPHHAAYVHEVACARSTDAVNDILGRLTPGVVELTDREADKLAARLAEDEPGATLEPWDWQFYAAKEAAASAFDTDQLKPYLEFEQVLTKGVFAAATALYGITFHERPELVGYTEQARVFEVKEEDGSTLGAVVIDPYTRPTKQGGAWMTSLVDQSHLLDNKPVVTNTCNVPPPAPGAPSLMTWDNVITLFHEFGHDLHGLLSDVRYPSRSGTSVPRDFVEFPSQVNEIWAWEPSLIAQYARHHETGEPVPAEWIEALVANRTESGRDTLETLAAMLLDQAWHQTPLSELPQDPEGVEAFEAVALQRAGAAHRLVPPRYRSAYFHHIFGGGYAAGYYSYLWSEVMDADTVAWFREQGDEANPGGMTRAAGDHFRTELLGRGGSIEAMDSYRRFRGADPEVSHLLTRLGLTD